MNKVSYLVALYNKEDFIVAAVESILNDHVDDLDVEVCIVDDGSTDRSLEVVTKKFTNDSRVKIDAFSVNKGKNAAYNRAFENSDGNYLTLLGADDEVVKGGLILLFNELKRSNKAVYGSSVKNIISTRKRVLICPPREPSFNKNIVQNKLQGGCVLMRRSQAEMIFPIPEDLKFEDWWISFHLLRTSDVVTITDPVVIYNIHDSNDAGAEYISLESLKKDYIRHFEYLDKFFPYLKSRKEVEFYNRSLDIRRSFFGKNAAFGLFSKPFDYSWLVLFLFSTFGPGFAIRLANYKASCKKIIKKV